MARVMAVALDVMMRPWEWGKADCCTSACSVLDTLHGVDPMHAFRGTYHDVRSAQRIIHSFGGFEAMVRTLALQHGLVPTLPVPGAVGVVTDRLGQSGLGICAQPGVWLAKTRHGMTTLPDAREMYRVAL